ncbi:uncharacterized protein BDV17DRAFT_252397 [Aspergillus undulatus]|uniref:uncharacterized protein n=1 Tax=Aspergillus undulatus TaxID=1810928 RepID=UPI003CCDB989
MGDVEYHAFDWDPVEDPPPEREPDIVRTSPRPRVLLSIRQWLGEYLDFDHLKNDPRVRRLEERPLVDAAALDYIWPPELEDQPQASLKGFVSSISRYFWPSPAPRSPSYMEGYTIDHPPKDLSLDGKDEASTTSSSLTLSDEPVRNADTDHAIDNLLALTQESADPSLEKMTLSKFEKLSKFGEQLRQRLEEVPDSLGPSEMAGYLLRVAYAGRRHLNWVAFRNVKPSVVAAAVASDELRDASALSLCVDQFELEGAIDHLAAALTQSFFKQLCFLQPPDRESDNASAGFCSRLLGASGGMDLLHSKTNYATSAFSTALRSRKFLTASSTISHGLPMVHIFTFVDSQRRDILDADASPSHSYSAYYSLANTLLTPEHFAARFLAYILSLGSYPLSGSDPDKAILRFAYTPASAYTTTVDDEALPPQWLQGQSAVRPIPAGFFDYGLAREDQRVRLRDIPPGSWVVLVHRDHRGGSSSSGSSPSDGMLQYAFVRVCQGSTDSASEEQQQQRHPGPAEVIAGLPAFMQKTAPESDVSWEKKVQEVESVLCARRAFASAKIGRPYNGSGIGVMAESRARALLQLL